MFNTNLSNRCDLPDPTTAIERLWHVLSDPDCELQEERQIILLNTFLSVAEERVKLRDLKLVTNILDALATKAEVSSKYQSYFQKMLNLLNTPIRMEKSSDHITYQDYVVEFFTTFGYILLHTSNQLVRLQVLDKILKVLLAKQVGDSDAVPTNHYTKALELSEFAECLADLIVLSEKEVYKMTMHTVLHISSMSKLCCWTLLKKEVLEILLIRLVQADDEEDAENICQLLWTLLNCTDCPDDWRRIPQPSRIALRGLRYVLRDQALTHSHPGRNRDLLHNIAALILKIIHLFPTADYVLSGLIEDITISATLSESVLETHLAPFFRSKGDHLHFKKLMLACLAAAPVTTLSVDLFKRYKLAECLVSMLRLDSCRNKLSWSCSKSSLGSLQSSRNSAVSNCSWFNINYEEALNLFKSVLPVVCTLFDVLHKRFTRAGLIHCLTSFLLTYYLHEKNEIDVTFHEVIKTIFFVCFSNKNPVAVRESLISSGAAHILLCSCVTIIDSKTHLTQQAQSTLSHMFLILSALMEDHPELQTRHETMSFQIVQSLYQRILKPLPTDFILDNRLIISVSNFAWTSLIANEQNLLKFVQSSEIYSHLDILERSNSSVQLVYLSMLVDIAEHYKSVPYLVSWRGPQGIKLLSLLCKIWQEEEKRLKVLTDEYGCIADVERPLMGEDQYNLSKDKSKCVSVWDVFGSCRPKIYALVQLLQRHQEVANICEDHYRLGHDVLSWDDQVTMQVVKAYLPLKLGEVWWEIFNKQEDALALDRDMTQLLADRYLNWSLSVQRAQHAVLKQRDADMKREEQNYYSKVMSKSTENNKVRSVRLTDALDALRQVTVIARTADRQIFLAAHSKLRQGVEDSRPSSDDYLSTLHVAFPQDVRVLVVNPQADVVLHHELPVDE